MTKTAVAPPPAITPKKVFARVMLVELDEGSIGILRDSFRQFGIQTVIAGGDAAHRLRHEKFEACVVRLSEPHSGAVLEAARTSPSNSRIILYGIAASLQQAMPYSRFGINAILEQPVERAAALKVVRSTHLLVLHELRRYARLPIITEVQLKAAGAITRATSAEISAGGMSLRTSLPASKDQLVEVSFVLPDMMNTISLRATVCWVRQKDGLIGVRFDPADEARLLVKRWIDNYLEVG